MTCEAPLASLLEIQASPERSETPAVALLARCRNTGHSAHKQENRPMRLGTQALHTSSIDKVLSKGKP